MGEEIGTGHLPFQHLEVDTKRSAALSPWLER